MMPEKYNSLVERIVKLHESQELNEMKSYLSKNAFETEGGWFTNNKFHEVCALIDKKLGRVESIEYVFDTKRKETIFTLWKAKYSNFKDVVLWQIIFDNDDNIFAMTVDWGEYNFNNEG